MSKRKISNLKLVIQLSRDESVFALCDKAGQIMHSIVLPTPEGALDDGMIRNAEAVRELIQSATSMPEFEGVHNVVFSLCTSQVITETVNTPDLPKGKLEKLIVANMDMYFPVDMSEYKLVWQTIEQKKNNAGVKEQSVQLWAVPTAMLPQYYAIANACNLSVSAIDFCGMSIATAVNASFSANAKSSKAGKGFDLKGALNKELTFGKKKKAEPEAAEEPPVSEELPDDEQVTQVHLTAEKDLIGLTFVQNHRVVHQRFIPTGSDPIYVIHDVAMMVEYFRSLDMGRSSAFVGYVSGSLCEDIDFVSELSMAMDLPLTPPDLGFDPRLVVCAGAARCKVDFGIRDLNKPNKELTQMSVQVGHTAALTVGGAALAGVVALTFVARFSWESTIEALEARRQDLAIQASKVAGFADKYKEYETLYNNYSSDWNTVFTSLRTYNDNLVRMLDELESILPEKTSVTALAIGADGLNVQFACENKEEAAYLIMQLRELQYANLAAISSLSGGGRGPAKTYGNGEAAPKEGSVELTTEQRNALASAFLKDFEIFKFISEPSKMNPTDIYAIETHYGNLPSTDIVISEATATAPEVTIECKTLKQLEDYMVSQGVIITEDMRKNAITTLLNVNPFSATRLANVLYEISQKGMGAVSEFEAISYALDLYNNKDKLTDRSTSDATKASMELMTSISTAPAHIKDTEKFIARDAILEQWYVYYLQDEVNKAAEEDNTEVPEEEIVECEFWALDTILADLLVEGKFSTPDMNLNGKLDAMLSADTQSALSAIIGSTDVTPTPPADVTPTPPAVVTPTPTPTPTPTVTPPSTLSFMGMTLEVANQQIEKYISEGQTDYYPLLDNQIEKYLTEGKSDYSDLDTALDMYINMGMGDDYVKMLVVEYLQYGTMKNSTLNTLVSDALKTGKTGNEAINKRITAAINDAENLNLAIGLIDSYMANGTTNFLHLDNMLNSYYTTGSTGAAILDTIVNYYNDAKVKQFLYPDGKTLDVNKVNEIKVMYATFNSSGISVNKFYDKLFTRYKLVGKSGSQYLDSLLSPQTPSQPSGGGGGGAAQQPVDTRIAFTVVLGYNNDLMKAELERKGLSNDSKVEMLEVNS